MAPYFSYTLNLIIVSLLATPILYCHLWGNPTIRGFYCDDESLDYPYHSSTIPSWALYFVGFGVPIVAIIGVEVTSFLKQTDHSDIKALVDILYPLIIGFLYGTATCQSLTDITKYTIGRLRPQFFDVCRPFYDLQDCGISPWHSDYVTNYTCQGNIDLFPNLEEREHSIGEIHLSFISGHASFAFQAATFFVLYIHARLQYKCENQNFLWALTQAIVVAAALYTSLSRVMDNKHHATDVIAGAFLGILIQFLNAMAVAKLYSCCDYGIGGRHQLPNEATIPLREIASC